MDFWIDVEPESEEMGTRLDTVLDICHAIYLWALDSVTEIWMKEKEIPKVGNLSKLLTEKIKRNESYRQVQRYTLNREIEFAISQFNQELKIREDGTIEFPKPVQRDVFTIPSRTIWKKYLEDFSRVSTAYGLLFMQGEWQKTMILQAKQNKITMDYMPYLWHSLSIRKKENRWQIHFNLHPVNSHQGKIAKNKMKREGFKAL